MATNSISVESHSCLPTPENLDALLEKLVAIFEVDSLLKGDPPVHPLQRSRNERDAGGRRTSYKMRPIRGNDFHIDASFLLVHCWEGMLQAEAGSEKLSLPLCGVRLPHPEAEAAAIGTVIDTAKKLVGHLRLIWPNASIGPFQRRQLGNVYHPETPTSRLYEWISSKDLNPISEGLKVHDLWFANGHLRNAIRHGGRGLTVKPVPESERKHLVVSTPLPGSEENRVPDAEIWTFTGPDRFWVMSLPVIATILLLMTNPTKDNDIDCPDRELSWCLDSLHGFCRKTGPEEEYGNLAWSLGTFPDCWMYLHFIFYYFTPCGLRDDSGVESDRWQGSGMRCDRRTISMPIGWEGKMKSFCEERIWLGMRTATGPTAEKEEYSGTVGFAFQEPYHFHVDTTEDDWVKSGLESPKEASGVALFQLLLLRAVDEWNNNWDDTLLEIERLHRVEDDVLDGKDPDALRDFMFDPSGHLGKEYFLTAHLLKRLLRHINAVPRSLREMKGKWGMTYPGRDSNPLIQRFDEATQLILRENWSKVVAHADECRDRLAARANKRMEELLSLRDSLFIARDRQP